ncbi:MAG: hypothetical protein NTW52_13290 [Planctomycetota bacterium]|nr:hypothetical protein [Planctomycetota bacterium]
MKIEPLALATGVDVATFWQMTSKTMAQKKMDLRPTSYRAILYCKPGRYIMRIEKLPESLKDL